VDIAALCGKARERPAIHEAIMTLTPTLYKIVTETLWQQARQSRRFRGAAIDLKDGFIHFSTAIR
jgi:hypothetical protein